MARKKLLVAAVIVGLFAGFLIFLYGQQMKGEKEAVMANPHDVIVAARPLPAGTLLTEDDVKIRQVPAQFLPGNPVLAPELNIYIGQPLSGDIAAEAMILTSDFAVFETARNLAGRIPAGERALTIPVDAVSGVAGLLRPGDRVDLMATFPVSAEDQLIPEAAGQDSIGYMTLSLLQNVTLLAVGQEFSEVGGGGAGRHNQRGGYANITVAVTPAEVELLIIAQTRGKIQLALRHREDMDNVDVRPRHLRQVLEELDILNQERAVRQTAPVVRRPTQPTTCPPDYGRDETGQCVRIIYRAGQPNP